MYFWSSLKKTYLFFYWRQFKARKLKIYPDKKVDKTNVLFISL